MRGGVAAVKVEAQAHDRGATKGSFYWHFKDLGALHHAMLELWESVATTRIGAAVRASGLDGRGELMLLVEMVSIRPGAVYGGVEVEPAVRDWGRIDPHARAVLERVDRQRLLDLQEFLAEAQVPKADLARTAELIYATVIGLESLRLTTGAEMGPVLRGLVLGLLDA